MARSYNRIELIGHVTHDPESRMTASGAPVCAFGLATNRSWTAESGERKEETAFHRIVAWQTLAEQCARLLRRGRRVFIAGRLSYRAYKREDGTEYPVAEIVIDEMLLLDDKRPDTSERSNVVASAQAAETSAAEASMSGATATSPTSSTASSAEELADEIPF